MVEKSLAEHPPFWLNHQLYQKSALHSHGVGWSGGNKMHRSHLTLANLPTFGSIQLKIHGNGCYILVGSPRSWILPLYCDFQLKLCWTVVSKPDVLHFFQLFWSEPASGVILPQAQNPTKTLHCTVIIPTWFLRWIKSKTNVHLKSNYVKFMETYQIYEKNAKSAPTLIYLKYNTTPKLHKHSNSAFKVQ